MLSLHKSNFWPVDPADHIIRLLSISTRARCVLVESESKN